MTQKPAPVRALIAGNWKMNGRRGDGTMLAAELARRARRASGGQGDRIVCDIVVCPPATLLRDVASAIADSPVMLGGQDCSAAASGAHTGDISAPMLADAGCRFVIVGHSERRTGHGETDDLVAAKAAAAHAAGLVPIICLGETEAERDAGQALAVVERQLLGSVPEGATADNTVVAYEPVWAIGSGRVPATADVAAVHGHLRQLAASRVAESGRLRLLYGGSVKPSNAAGLLAVDNVDGALVGGASLKADDFWAIVQGCR